MTALLSLLRVYFRYWRKHRLQALLSLLGISLGVAVFVAIRLANQGALVSFRANIEAFAGRATHRIFSPAGHPVPEHLFTELLNVPAVEAATPYLRGRLWIQRDSTAPLTSLTVHGIDVISGADFEAFEAADPDSASPESAIPRKAMRSLTERLLAEPGAVLLSRRAMHSLSLKPGDRLRARTADGVHTLTVLGSFAAPEGREAALADAAVADIATFQEIFARLGTLDEIRLRLGDGGKSAIEALLPPGLTLEAAGRRGERMENMAAAFQLNLEALGLFALLVAVFLIFNASTFSVVQRGTVLGFLRCIGASRRAVFTTLLLEGLLLGAVGGVLGVLGGVWLAEVMLKTTSATVAEVILDWHSATAAVQQDWETWFTGVLLGMIVAGLGVLAPALEGGRASPLAAIRGSHGAPAHPIRLALLSAMGLACLAAAAVLALDSQGSVLSGLASATAIAVGCALLCPLALLVLSWLATPLLSRLLGATGRMAGRNLRRSLSRSGVAAASLMVALALALAIDITVRSFRQTFVVWMEQAVTGDLYVSAPKGDGGGPISPMLLERLRAQPWMAYLTELRSRRVVLGTREVRILAVDLNTFGRRARLPVLRADPEQALAGLERGEVLVSETLAYPLGLRQGGSLRLPTPLGARDLRIAAVVQNYSFPSGVVYMEQARFETFFGRLPVRQIEVWLKPGTDAAYARRAIGGLPGGGRLKVELNAAIREDAMRVFNRSFAITDLMGSLAAFVAFISVVSALTAVLEERLRTLGYLRAIGVPRGVLGLSMSLEAALLALTATLMSWGAGLAMAIILIFVVNRRSFGWTLQFHPESGSYLFLLALAIGAALLGSIYPILRATRLSVAATIREE
ncbi:MAG: ABC transporter permease [SAR324 cluster bacterium]|nr:ABC transporter permease [SAR324 cluster bacterium]